MSVFLRLVATTRRSHQDQLSIWIALNPNCVIHRAEAQQFLVCRRPFGSKTDRKLDFSESEVHRLQPMPVRYTALEDSIELFPPDFLLRHSWMDNRLRHGGSGDQAPSHPPGTCCMA